MNSKVVIGAVLAASVGQAAAGAEQSIEDRIQVLDRQAEGVLVPAGDLPNTCGSAPLPLTPQGPVVNATLTYGTRSPIEVQAWRYPCSASDSMVVLTLTPTNADDPSFVCQPRFQLLQPGGLQTGAFDVKNDPLPISSYCEEVVSPVTVAFVPRGSTPTAFDFDQALTIDYDGLSAGHQTVAIAAYNPALYDLTPIPGVHAVKVHVRGSGSSFRNCTVSIAPMGAGNQYTASCDSEAPLKVNGFDKYER